MTTLSGSDLRLYPHRLVTSDRDLLATMSYNRNNRQPYNSGGRYRQPYNSYQNQYRGPQVNQAEQVSNLVAQALADIEKKKAEASEKQALLKAMQAMQETVTQALKRKDGDAEPPEPKRARKSKREEKTQTPLNSQDDDDDHQPDLVEEWDPDTVTPDQVRMTSSKILPLSLVLGLKNCEAETDVSNLIKSKYKSGAKFRKPQLLAVGKQAGSLEKSPKKLYDFILSVATLTFQMVICYIEQNSVEIPFPICMEENERESLRSEVTDSGLLVLSTKPTLRPRVGLKEWVTRYVIFCQLMVTLYCAGPTLHHINFIFRSIASPHTRLGWLATESWSVPNIVYMAFSVKDGSFYVGETSLTLCDRIYSHLSCLKTDFARTVWRSPSEFVFVPLHHCHTVIGRHAPPEQKRIFRRKIEYILIRALRPNLNGEYSPRFIKPGFSRMPQRHILNSMLNRTPRAVITWEIMLYKIKVGTSPPVETPTLDSSLLCIPDNSVITVSIARHGCNITDFGKCRSLFAASRTLGHTSHLLSPFNKSRLFTSPITFILSNPSVLQPDRVLTMTKPSVEYLVGAMISAEALRNFLLRDALRSKLRLLYGMTIKKQYILRMHESILVPDSYVRQLLFEWIDSCDMPSSVKAIVRRRLSIVRKKSKTIGDHLFNYRQHDTKVNLNASACCTCGAAPGAQHLKVLARDHPNSLVALAGTLGAHFVPSQSRASVSNSIEISTLKTDISAAIPLRLRHLLDGKLLQPPTDLVTKIMAQGYSLRNDSAITSDAITAILRTLKGLVISPCDKNAKVMLIECPIRRAESLKKCFLSVPHYTVLRHDDQASYNAKRDAILKQMDTFLDRKEIQAIDSKRKGASLPYNYVLSKYKDINRSRPVTSFYFHPVKKVYRKVGAALNYLLTHWPIANFNLDQVSDVTAFLRKAKVWKEKMTTFGLETAELQWDIREMFTNVPQHAIISSITTIMDSFHQTYLWVSPDGKQRAVSTHRTHQATIRIDFGTILSTVQFDVDTAFSTLGTRVILHQRIGIPIGGIMSSTIARAVVSVMEAKTLLRNPILNHIVLGGRYTDDMRLYAASHTKEAAVELISTLAHNTYGSGLTVEMDNQPENFFVFVGMKGCKDGTFHPYNKNETESLSGAPQKFIRYQRSSSSVSRAQKYSGCVGALVYLADHSSNTTELRKGVIATVAEFRNLGFERKFIMNAYWKALSARPSLSHVTDFKALIDQTFRIVRTKS